jgi:hypothetical protein
MIVKKQKEELLQFFAENDVPKSTDKILYTTLTDNVVA